MSVTIRRATPQDVEDYWRHLPKTPSVRAYVGVDEEGNILGAGGVYLERGRWMAFCEVPDDNRHHKMAIMRTAIRIFRELKEAGVKYVYARIDPREPKALEWAERLGFELDMRSQFYYRWSGK